MNVKGRDISYNLLYPLGEGTYGITFLAEGSDGQKYAIKQYKQVGGAEEDRDFEEMTLRTILSVCQRYATCFIESINDSQGMFIVMDYIDGQSVFNAVFTRSKIPRNQRIAVGQQFIKDLVLGLNQIHKMGLIHQDIKGDNLMYTKDGHVKYIDFGLSCLVSTAQIVGGTPVFGNYVNGPCGSPGTWTTAPPEMFNYTSGGLVQSRDQGPDTDNGVYSIDYLMAHDVWSIGCEILSWYAIPDNSRDWTTAAYAVSFLSNDFTPIFDEIKSRDEVAYKVICGLLHRNPKQRIQNFNEIENYYSSFFGSLKDFPNTWNQFGVTQQVRRELQKFRCSLVQLSDVQLTNRQQTQMIGASKAVCAKLEQDELIISARRNVSEAIETAELYVTPIRTQRRTPIRTQRKPAPRAPLTPPRKEEEPGLLETVGTWLFGSDSTVVDSPYIPSESPDSPVRYRGGRTRGLSPERY